MIASVFGKSKPINIIIVAAFIIIFMGGVIFTQMKPDYSEIVSMTINLLVIIFSLFVLDFINSKNNLTLKNSYAVLFFGLFVVIFPQIIKHSDYLWSNLFVLFALRRLISLHSRKSIKKKLFDASFWISLAAILNPWALLFMVLVIISVVNYSGNDVKTAVIPLLGVSCVFILKVCYNILFFDTYVLESDFSFGLLWDFSIYWQPISIVILAPLILLLLWSMIKLIRQMKERNAQLKSAYMLLFWMMMIAMTVSLLSNPKDGGEFIYCMAPASLILALNIETIKRPWLLNSVLTVLLILPVLRLIYTFTP